MTTQFLPGTPVHPSFLKFAPPPKLGTQLVKFPYKSEGYLERHGVGQNGLDNCFGEDFPTSRGQKFGLPTTQFVSHPILNTREKAFFVLARITR